MCIHKHPWTVHVYTQVSMNFICVYTSIHELYMCVHKPPWTVQVCTQVSMNCTCVQYSVIKYLYHVYIHVQYEWWENKLLLTIFLSKWVPLPRLICALSSPLNDDHKFLTAQKTNCLSLLNISSRHQLQLINESIIYDHWASEPKRNFTQWSLSAKGGLTAIARNYEHQHIYIT